MKTVFISGHFNVLHPGHIRLFKFARECGTRLVVGVESDRQAGQAAHISENLRLEGVQINGYVDEAFLFDRPVTEIVASLKPDVIIKGREHEGGFNPELEIVKRYGGQLLFGSGDSVFSSSDLLRHELDSVQYQTISLPADYIKRNGIKANKIVELLGKMQKITVVVLGDLIIDEYISCQPLGMSQEDPTIVVTPTDSKKFIGGSGIVAAHAAGLGAEVSFLSVAGCDPMHEFAIEQLERFGVSADILQDPARPTTLKQRYRSQGKSLLRVSHLHQDTISEALQKELLERVEENLNRADLVVFSDFNYGCLPQTLVDKVTSMVKSGGALLAADSQSSSQIGDIGRFKHMDLITPTEREARISMKNQEDGLVVLAERLKSIAGAEHILLKMGEEGLLVQTTSENEEDIYTDQVPALNSSAKDVAGAGDSLLISSAMAMAAGANIWEMGLIGSMASAIQVGRVGNVPLSMHELIEQFSK